MGNRASRPDISVIIPALNEENNVSSAVQSALACERCEVIVVDGGSIDLTQNNARRAGARVVESPRGRARQQNKGASLAQGDIVVFLHADSRLPNGWEHSVKTALSSGCPSSIEQPRELYQWGCFQSIAIDAHPFTAWLVQKSVAVRTRTMHRPYGDQALFVGRHVFHQSGGFPDTWPLLEDVDLVDRLRQRCGPPAIVPADIETSGRRWRALGLVRTTLVNQAILAGYALGVDVHHLAKWYERSGPRCDAPEAHPSAATRGI